MSIGEALAEARREADLTVTQVSDQVRIREMIITGIEGDDYSACGGDSYARGYIRIIARAVGADPEPLIREYNKASKRADGSAGETRQPGRAGKEIPIEGDAAATPGMSGRVSGLDGVRALAVLAVIAFHLGMLMTPGGFLGVDIFFVLSGYLITDLLVAQHVRLGRVDLRGFWVRRARRLLPALAVILVAVTAVVAVIEPDQMSALRPMLAAAVSYSSNWYQAFHHVSYFASVGPPPPLQHLWSLAIEEQFYLAWPLLLLVLTRLRARRTLVLTAWLGALASAVAMALMYVPGGDPSRVYYGTDTHATALLVGAAVALTWPLATLTDAPRRVARRLDCLGVAAVVVLAWAVVHFSGTDPAVYPLGLAGAALAAGGLTVAAAAPGRVGALLSLPPLRWLGLRSYGIYLWHWPVIAIAAAITGPGRAAPWAWAVEVAIAITLAAASWKWLEEPVLRNGFRGTCRTVGRALGNVVPAAGRCPVRALPVLWAAAALAITCIAGYGVFHAPSGPSGMEKQILQGERVSIAARVQESPSAAGPAVTGSPSPPPSASAAPCKVSGRQVTAIGDSVMLAGAMALDSVLPGIYIDGRVSRQMPAGLRVVRSLAGSGPLRPVVVVGLGTNGIVTTEELHQLMHLLGPHRTLVLINTYVQEPWSKEVNGTMAAFTRQHPNVVLADWFDMVKDRTYLLWPDKIHPQLPGTKVYARMVDRAVQETCGVPSSPSPAAPPADPAGPPQPHTPGPRQSRLAIRDRLEEAAGPAGGVAQGGSDAAGQPQDGAGQIGKVAKTRPAAG